MNDKLMNWCAFADDNGAHALNDLPSQPSINPETTQITMTNANWISDDTNNRPEAPAS